MRVQSLTAERSRTVLPFSSPAFQATMKSVPPAKGIALGWRPSMRTASFGAFGRNTSMVKDAPSHLTFFPRSLSPPNPSCPKLVFLADRLDDRVDDVLVAGTTAQSFRPRTSRIDSGVVATALTHIRPRRHQEARCAYAALRAAFVQKRLLQYVERFGSTQRLDGFYLSPLHLTDWDETAVHRHAIHQHRAGAALPLAAALFGAGEVVVFAQNVDETFESVTLEEPWFPIDAQS